MWRHGGRIGIMVSSLAFSAAAFPAELAPPSGPSSSLQDILVIGATPVPGMRTDADRVPGRVQSASAEDLTRDGPADLTGALDRALSGVTLSDTLGDPFQPDVLYRGFDASPVLGTPQGIAVYQNGVRINEAFGDTVNWDLIPDNAIDHVDLLNANPLYGLNALGGALSLTMKNGFTHHGGEAEVGGGSFTQRGGSAQWGGDQGVLGLYVAVHAVDQNGWRLFAHDALRQTFAAVSLRKPALALDLSAVHADNRLFGPGAAPVQSLAIDPGAVFTGPQENLDALDFVTLTADAAVSPSFAVQGVTYVRRLRQQVENGNATAYVACSDAYPGSLCQPDASTPLRDATGALITDLANGRRALGEDDTESIDSLTWGASLQATSTRLLFDHGNQAAVGLTFDDAHTQFRSAAVLGLLDSSLQVLPGGPTVDTPEGTPFVATPVALDARTTYYGMYGTDILELDSKATVTASGRFNVAQVNLLDLRGANLDGDARYAHFNPALGATYVLSPTVTAFADISVNNRAPTASEIECSSPTHPCLLPSSLAADPPALKQVIAHTIETGLRGGPGRGTHGLQWNASLFRTELDDDIYGVATALSSGYFRNIGATRRQGLETGATYRDALWSAYAQYSYVASTFRSSLLLSSPFNPYADASGDIHVRPGDELPGIPRHRLKTGVDAAVGPDFTLGASIVAVGAQRYHGDESNQSTPLPGFAVIDLRSSYRPGRRTQCYVTIRNLLNKRYATYGTFGNPTGVGAPGVPTGAAPDTPGVDDRFTNPAAPRSVAGGIRITF